MSEMDDLERLAGQYRPMNEAELLGNYRTLVRDLILALAGTAPKGQVVEHMRRALRLSSDSCLLVGNMSHQRTTWLVISVLNRIDSPHQLTLEESER